jgi:hypothetical protein
VNIKIKWYEQKMIDWYEKIWFMKLFVDLDLEACVPTFWNEFLTEYWTKMFCVYFSRSLAQFFISWKSFLKFMVMTFEKLF